MHLTNSVQLLANKVIKLPLLLHKSCPFAFIHSSIKSMLYKTKCNNKSVTHQQRCRRGNKPCLIVVWNVSSSLTMSPWLGSFWKANCNSSFGVSTSVTFSNASLNKTEPSLSTLILTPLSIEGALLSTGSIRMLNCCSGTVFPVSSVTVKIYHSNKRRIKTYNI